MFMFMTKAKKKNKNKFAFEVCQCLILKLKKKIIKDSPVSSPKFGTGKTHTHKPPRTHAHTTDVRKQSWSLFFSPMVFFFLFFFFWIFAFSFNNWNELIRIKRAQVVPRSYWNSSRRWGFLVSTIRTSASKKKKTCMHFIFFWGGEKNWVFNSYFWQIQLLWVLVLGCVCVFFSFFSFN